MTLTLFGVSLDKAQPTMRIVGASNKADAEDDIDSPEEAETRRSVIRKFKRVAREDNEDRAVIERTGIHPTVYYATSHVLSSPTAMVMRFQRVSVDVLRGICLYRLPSESAFSPEEINLAWKYMEAVEFLPSAAISFLPTSMALGNIDSDRPPDLPLN